MQRFFDLFFSTIALLILFPFFVPIIITLYLTGEGEIFYIQQRVCKDGKMFGLIKFATMLKDSPNLTSGTVTVKDDPRVLPFGKFLRKTKINELPQLINIFKGDMSVIGPRPQTERCFFAFPKVSQKEIIKVKPGLSGIGSIIFRDEEKILGMSKLNKLKFYDETIAPYKGELEQWYVENKSLYLYFVLIILTIWIVIFPKSRFYEKILKDLPPLPDELIVLSN